MMRIGIPRALMFYRYYPFMKTFLEGCGFEVLASPPTDLRILEKGAECCVDDICVPVKAFFGHVDFLKDRVDALLVPRLVSVEKRKHDTFTCPKLIAAPDMIRFFPLRPPLLLEWVVDVNRVPWWWGCLKLAGKLRVAPRRAWEAYREARLAQRRYEALLRRGYLPQEALVEMERGTSACRHEGNPVGEVTVAVVGHPYILGDALINKNLFLWLRRSGAGVSAGTIFPPEELERETRQLPDLSWSYERELLAAASCFLRRREVDGVIYLTSFGCGPDSMVVEMFKWELLPRSGKAFLEVVLDEHSAEAGVRTRVEAFVDLLRYRKVKKAGEVD